MSVVADIGGQVVAQVAALHHLAVEALLPVLEDFVVGRGGRQHLVQLALHGFCAAHQQKTVAPFLPQVHQFFAADDALVVHLSEQCRKFGQHIFINAFHLTHFFLQLRHLFLVNQCVEVVVGAQGAQDAVALVLHLRLRLADGEVVGRNQLGVAPGAAQLIFVAKLALAGQAIQKEDNHDHGCQVRGQQLFPPLGKSEWIFHKQGFCWGQAGWGNYQIS